VQRVTRGERGVLVGDDPLHPGPHVSAFEPVTDYGWGVIAGQAASAAFAGRRSARRSVLAMCALMLLVAVLAAYVVISGLETLRLAQARQEELVRTQTELEQMKLFNFAASHDLQEPLHKLTLFADVLEREHGAALGPRGRKRLETLVQAAARMRALVEQTLQLARVVTQAQTPAPLALDDVLEAVRTELAPTIEATGAQVEIMPLPRVRADRAQMETLFRNLLANALKFRRPEEPPQVRVACVGTAAGRCEIAVADHGIGFEERYAERIFEPFQRLHGRHAYPGSGLGLAICERIVQRHGGTLTARSVPGAGATFVASLPMVSAKEA
jgi:signal transduction histidine kinase